MVGKKFVLPYVVEISDFWSKINYWVVEKLNDIDKALCYLAGKEYGSIVTIRYAIETALSAKYNKCSSDWILCEVPIVLNSYLLYLVCKCSKRPC
jgi:hypothetical protein